MWALAEVSDPRVLQLREYLECPGRQSPVGVGASTGEKKALVSTASRFSCGRWNGPNRWAVSW